jgi:DNA mismatch repair protein MutS
VSAQQGEKLMTPEAKATFIHRQTLAGAMRFTSVELGELESKIVGAAERALALELMIFDRLTKEVLVQANALEVVAD